MSARPGCVAGFLFVLAVLLVQFVTMVVVVMTVLAIRNRHGDAPAFVALVVLGPAGWWLLFRVVEPRQERAAVRLFGSPGGSHVLDHFRPWMKGWRRFGYLWVTAAPALLFLLRHC